MNGEFQAFPKIPRLRRDVVITEKIDGTNACIVIARLADIFHNEEVSDQPAMIPYAISVQDDNGENYFVAAQSRNRFIMPGNDNAGFADFVWSNRAALVNRLGAGYHYGEWYGQKIARTYGLTERRLALFNTKRWGFLNTTEGVWPELPNVHAVPVLGGGVLSDELVDHFLTKLRIGGSVAVPGFMRPEGIVVFHTSSNQLYKVLLEGDELPKGVYTRQEREIAAAEEAWQNEGGRDN